MEMIDEPDHHPQPGRPESWLHGTVSRRSMLASAGLAGVGALAAGTFAGRVLFPDPTSSTTGTTPTPDATASPSAGQASGSAALPTGFS
jgi:hypothetical protein